MSIDVQTDQRKFCFEAFSLGTDDHFAVIAPIIEILFKLHSWVCLIIRYAISLRFNEIRLSARNFSVNTRLNLGNWKRVFSWHLTWGGESQLRFSRNGNKCFPTSTASPPLFVTRSPVTAVRHKFELFRCRNCNIAHTAPSVSPANLRLWRRKFPDTIRLFLADWTCSGHFLSWISNAIKCGNLIMLIVGSNWAAFR